MGAVNPAGDSTGLISLLPDPAVWGPLIIAPASPLWVSPAVPLGWVSPIALAAPVVPPPVSPPTIYLRTSEGAMWCWLHILASRSVGSDSKLNLEISPIFDGVNTRVTRKPVLEYLLDLVAYPSERYFMNLDIEDVGEGFVVAVRLTGGASEIVVNTLQIRRGTVAQGHR